VTEGKDRKEGRASLQEGRDETGAVTSQAEHPEVAADHAAASNLGLILRRALQAATPRQAAALPRSELRRFFLVYSRLLRAPKVTEAPLAPERACPLPGPRVRHMRTADRAKWGLPTGS